MIGRITSFPSSSCTTQGRFTSAYCAEDGGLRLADHRRPVEGAVPPGFVDRERAALHLVGESCLFRARSAMSVTACAMPRRFSLGVLDDRDDQALPVGELDGEAEVDEVSRVTILSPRISPLIHGYSRSVSVTARATKIR